LQCNIKENSDLDYHCSVSTFNNNTIQISIDNTLLLPKSYWSYSVMIGALDIFSSLTDGIYRFIYYNFFFIFKKSILIRIIIIFKRSIIFRN